MLCNKHLCSLIRVAEWFVTRLLETHFQKFIHEYLAYDKEGIQKMPASSAQALVSAAQTAYSSRLGWLANLRRRRRALRMQEAEARNPKTKAGRSRNIAAGAPAPTKAELRGSAATAVAMKTAEDQLEQRDKSVARRLAHCITSTVARRRR